MPLAQVLSFTARFVCLADDRDAPRPAAVVQWRVQFPSPRAGCEAGVARGSGAVNGELDTAATSLCASSKSTQLRSPDQSPVSPSGLPACPRL